MLNILMAVWNENLKAMDKFTAECGHAIAAGRREGNTIILTPEAPPVPDPAPEAAKPAREPLQWRRRYYVVPGEPGWLGASRWGIEVWDDTGGLHTFPLLTFKSMTLADQVASLLQQAYNDGLWVGSRGELPALDGDAHGDDENHGVGERGRGSDGVRAASDPGAG